MTSKPNNSWLHSIGKKGEFLRKDSQFRNWVKSDGSTPFQPENNRYHLYISHACPWANRTSILRSLKGLDDVISMTVVDPYLETGGWKFIEPEPINHKQHLREIYLMCQPEYDANITVPVLFDKKLNTIVNNESSEIIRMLNSEFNQFSATKKQAELDLYPVKYKDEIEELNSWIYPTINNGVYRCDFAKSQEAYEEAFDTLFKSLDKIENILSKQRYLTSSNQITEADIRLLTTLLRFDPVYFGHFKCNLHRIVDYPNIWDYVRELYQMNEIKRNIDFTEIKLHYYKSHKQINPTQIIPKGPEINWDEPHNREKLFPIQ